MSRIKNIRKPNNNQYQLLVLKPNKMDPKNIKKEYSNGEITIIWQSGKCIHAANCVKHNPDVFRPKMTPWIQTSGSSTAKIIDTILQCPSGALSYHHNIKNESFGSLIEAIDYYRKQGYTEDFNLRQNCLECRNGSFKVFHNEFNIDKFYRFEEDTNPEDQSIIYAISSDKYDLKGILINAYGIYSEPITDEMLKKLK